jgi:hypothetical protein
MKTMLLTLAVMMTGTHWASATLPHVKAELTYAPNVPPPITRHESAVVEVDLTATHKLTRLTTYADYQFWTFIQMTRPAALKRAFNPGGLQGSFSDYRA